MVRGFFLSRNARGIAGPGPHEFSPHGGIVKAVTLMCGICGFVATGATIPERVLLDMNARIARRGPDGAGHLYEENVGLAMRRLAIIDLAGGQQPIFNETGNIAIVFNGEIYNYRQLRDKLAKQGHKFRPDSDTEVIVHLYENLGNG